MAHPEGCRNPALRSGSTRRLAARHREPLRGHPAGSGSRRVPASHQAARRSRRRCTGRRGRLQSTRRTFDREAGPAIREYGLQRGRSGGRRTTVGLRIPGGDTGVAAPRCTRHSPARARARDRRPALERAGLRVRRPTTTCGTGLASGHPARPRTVSESSRSGYTVPACDTGIEGRDLVARSSRRARLHPRR